MCADCRMYLTNDMPYARMKAAPVREQIIGREEYAMMMYRKLRTV